MKAKPPLGVRPITLYLEERISELGRAIGEHTMRGFVTEKYAKLISEWMIELQERITEYQDILWDKQDREE